MPQLWEPLLYRIDDVEQRTPLSAEILRQVVEIDGVVKNEGHSQEEV